MELKDFISKAVSEIVTGIDDASSATKKKVSLYSIGKDNQRHIEFDVAVTVEKKDGKGGKAGVRVLEFVEVGGKKFSETANTTVSRVRFGVRVK